MHSKCLLGIAFCVLLVGCDEASLIKRFTPPQEESTAKRYVDLLRQRAFDQIMSNLDPNLVTPGIKDTFSEMADQFPDGDAISVKVVDVSRNVRYSTRSITLEYQFPSKWLTAEISTKADLSTIVDFRVTPLSDSVEHINRFTLVGKSVVQYSILAVAVGAFAFSLYVLVLCIRTKGLRKKWLWVLFILAGVEKVAVNWSTGQLTFGILAINFPCFQAMRTGYGPWTIGAFLPLGAILFFKQRRRTKIVDPAAVPSVEAADANSR